MGDERAGRHGDAGVWIKIRSTAHPPCSGQHGDEPIVGMEMLIAGQPFRHDAVETGLCGMSEQDCLLIATRSDRAPVDLIGQLEREFGIN